MWWGAEGRLAKSHSQWVMRTEMNKNQGFSHTQIKWSTLFVEFKFDFQLVCRYETKTFVSPEAISSDLAKKIRNLHRKILGLPKMMRTFSGKGNLLPFHLSLSFPIFKTRIKPPSRPVMLAPGRLRQEDLKFQASLDYTVKLKQKSANSLG